VAASSCSWGDKGGDAESARSPASRTPSAHAVENAIASTRPRCIATRMSTPRPSPACASAVSTRYPRAASCIRMSYTPFHTTNATANQRISNLRGTSPLGLPHTLARGDPAPAPLAWLTRCRSFARSSSIGHRSIPQHQRGDVVALRGAFREGAHVREDRLQELGRRQLDVLLRHGDDSLFAVFLAV